jgi:hypothetical protein
MCGVAAESHKTRCALEKSLVATDKVPDGVGEHDVSEVTTPGETDLANMDKIDQQGFSLSTSCPFKSGKIAEIGDQAIDMDFGPICEYGPWMRRFILLLAGIAVAYIMSGNTRSGGII